MPLAWEVVALQIGYLGLRLDEWRQGVGLLLTGVIGAINIPFYEEMALRVHWWRYVNCWMLLHTPGYIILGEFLIAITIGYLGAIDPRGAMFAVVAGRRAGGTRDLRVLWNENSITVRNWKSGTRVARGRSNPFFVRIQAVEATPGSSISAAGRQRRSPSSS